MKKIVVALLVLLSSPVYASDPFGQPPEAGMVWVNLPGIGWGWATPRAVELITTGRPATQPQPVPQPQPQPSPLTRPDCPNGRCPNPQQRFFR